jgi:hypothetical protein
MKKMVTLGLVLALALGLFACVDPKDDGSTKPADHPIETIGHWDGLCSQFTRRGSSQYSNGTLQAKEIDGGLALFEFDLMEGSEAEDRADSLRIPGVLIIQEDLTGLFESVDKNGKTVFTIQFVYAEDGQSITVTHTGDVPMNPDGVFDWIGVGVECSEGTARELIENLPTAATSLNGNLGAYTIQYPDESVLNYFYPVSAVFDDTGKTLASFLVTNDLSAVYRLDTEDGVPVLVYGTAQDILDRQTDIAPEEGDDAAEAGTVSLLPVVSAEGTLLAPGTESNLKLDAPWPFACSFEGLLSVNDDVATVSEDGVITAHRAGSTTITGTVILDDGKTKFGIDLTVGADGTVAEEAQTEAAVG